MIFVVVLAVLIVAGVVAEFFDMISDSDRKARKLLNSRLFDLNVKSLMAEPPDQEYLDAGRRASILTRTRI